jgi:hypothetical protein
MGRDAAVRTRARGYQISRALSKAILKKRILQFFQEDSVLKCQWIFVFF